MSMEGDDTRESYIELKNEDKSNHMACLSKSNHGKANDDTKHPMECKDSIVSIQHLVCNATANNKEKGSIDFTSNSPSSSTKANELEHAKAEMGQVKEENEKLRVFLEQIRNKYKALQMQLMDTLKKDEAKSVSPVVDDQESELVSLSLGRYSRSDKSENAKTIEAKDKDAREGLSLALDFMLNTPVEHRPGSSSPANCSDESQDNAAERWPQSRVAKRVGEEDASLQQTVPAKKVRVSVRARCDTPTMNDGCQWRKYGQKIAKGNPCPRAYYRCTVAPLCPVRKQVQRCAEDMSILITTYEGTHNHPLPMSATAMASTTSAAASMILSGSSTSHYSQTQTSTNMAADLYGLNLYLSSADNSKLKQFYVHNSSLSSSPSYPTITLDLAPGAPSNLYSKFSSSSSKFAISNGLSFASPPEPTNPMQWGSGILSYGSSTPAMSFGRNYQVPPSLNIGRPLVDYTQKSSFQSDAVAAATKAITNDPNFQSALVAALTSIISNGASASPNNGGLLDALTQKIKWGDHHQPLQSGSSSYQSQQKSTYFNRNTSSDSVVFLPPSLSFSSPGSGSTSLGDKKKENAD